MKYFFGFWVLVSVTYLLLRWTIPEWEYWSWQTLHIYLALVAWEYSSKCWDKWWVVSVIPWAKARLDK